MKTVGRGIILATAAAVLLSSPSFAADNAAKNAKPVKCHGVNSCRGKGNCGSANSNACAGQNSCKGRGWQYMSEKQCKAQGGEVTK